MIISSSSSTAGKSLVLSPVCEKFSAKKSFKVWSGAPGKSLEANDNNRKRVCNPQLKQSTCNMKKFQALYNLPNVTTELV